MRNLIIALAVLCFAAAGFADEKPAITIEEILAKHVASLGTPDALAAAPGRGVEAGARFAVTQGGGGAAEGTAKFGSSAAKTRFNLRVNSPSYMGEDFTCDGNKVQVSRLVGGKSTLLGASFFYDKQFLIKEGIFGGVLSTAWPLLHPDQVRAKLKYTGTKKIDGRDLYEVRYEPKDDYPGLQVRLYFEPETFRHVLTEYEWHVRSGMGGSTSSGRGRSLPTATDQGTEILRESFSNFQSVDDLTLPALWTIDLSKELSGTSKMHWEFNVSDTVHGDLDQAMFKVK